MHSSFLYGSPGIDLWVVRVVPKLERRKKKKKRKNNDRKFVWFGIYEYSL